MTYHRITTGLFEEIEKVMGQENQLDEAKLPAKSSEAGGSEPKTDKHKQLAAMGHPKDKVTHKDVLIARGVVAKEEAELEEEVEELDELKKSTLASYAKKAGKDAMTKRSIAGGFDANAARTRKPALKQAGTMLAKDFREKARKREGNIDKAIDRLAKEEVDLDIAETIIRENDFTIEVPSNPTYADYLAAAKQFVEEDDIVTVAEAFFAERDESIIIEAFTRADIDAKVKAHQKAGNQVTMPKITTKNGQPYAEYVVTDKNGVRRKYIHHGTSRKVENMGPKTKRDRGQDDM